MGSVNATRFVTPRSIQFARVQPNISTITTTVVISAVAAKTVSIYRMFLNFDATQTVDIQDTAGAVLTGGPLSFGANGSLLFDFFGEPWFVPTVGLGLQFVSSTTGKIRGFIDYLQV